MVRDTLGEDAVIVATREETGGKAVSVTAAIEPAFELGRGNRSNGTNASQDWLQYDDEDEESAVAEEITEALIRHSVPETVMDNIISCATVIGLENPMVALIAALEHLYNFKPLPDKAYKKAIMMVGPPGSGKTLAVAKMAARSVMNDLNVHVITSDTVRAGGVEQLAAFTKLLNVNLIKAETPRDMKHAIQGISEYDQILIDTPGTNPFNQEDVKTIAQMIGAEDIDPHLVLPTGIDAEEAGEMARIFSTLGVNTLISSRTDITRRYGGMLAAAHYGSMSFADISNTPKVADGLVSLSPKTLAKLIMPTGMNALRERETRRTGTQ